MPPLSRVPITIGQSGATVVRVSGADGAEWIEKSGTPSALAMEARVMTWCAAHLPVPAVQRLEAGTLSMSALPGVDLTRVPLATAAAVMAEALDRIHRVPANHCPFQADWATRLSEAAGRVAAGLVDERDFDEENYGRSAADVLAELRELPPVPRLTCFTHGDACLPNFLTQGGKLTGVIDLGRAGLGHPAQDWALALRSLRDNGGPAAERLLREHLPDHCQDDALLRRFRLLDELF